MSCADVRELRLRRFALIERGPVFSTEDFAQACALLDPLCMEPYPHATQLKARQVRTLMDLWLQKRPWNERDVGPRHLRALQVACLRLCAALAGLDRKAARSMPVSSVARRVAVTAPGDARGG